MSVITQQRINVPAAELENQSVRAIVIDIKFGETCQAGFAGDDSPKIVFPVAKEKKDSLESLYRDIFSQLAVDPSEYAVLLTETPTNSVENRLLLIKLMFETFNVPIMYICVQPTLSMCASGKLTGCAVELGEYSSYAAPIVDGALVMSALTPFDITGSDLITYMMRILHERGYPFKTAAEREIIRDCNKNLGYVAFDYEKEMASKSTEIEKMYQLPDGQIITVGAERFRCPELLFKPNLMGRDEAGLPQTINDSIRKLIIQNDKNDGTFERVRADIYNNIVLSGTASIFDGIDQRLKKDILALAPNGMVVNVIAQPYRAYSSWIGGSIAADLIKQLWITKQEYDQAAGDQEKVTTIIQKKLGGTFGREKKEEKEKKEEETPINGIINGVKQIGITHASGNGDGGDEAEAEAEAGDGGEEAV